MRRGRARDERAGPNPEVRSSPLGDSERKRGERQEGRQAPEFTVLTFVSCAIFLLIFRCRSCVYSMAMPDWKGTLVAEGEVNFP